MLRFLPNHHEYIITKLIKLIKNKNLNKNNKKTHKKQQKNMIFNLFFYVFKFIKNIMTKIRYLASNKYAR